MTLGEGVYTMNAESEQGAGIALVETYGIEMSSVEDFVSNASGGGIGTRVYHFKSGFGYRRHRWFPARAGAIHFVCSNG